MRVNFRHAAWIVMLFVLALVLTGCAKEQKEARLEVAEHEFVIRREDPDTYVIDARGVIRNTGEVDVKNVEVTGYCRSCGEQIVGGKWFVSQYEKMEHQKDVIAYLPAGGREEFEFEEVAFYPIHRVKTPPEGLPEGLEIVIESYEVAE